MNNIINKENFPITYQEISDYFVKYSDVTPFSLRKETFLKIEEVTGIPLICYVAKTHNVSQDMTAYIDDSDLTGFGDLIHSTQSESVNIFIVSNGGSVEATERIVHLLRERFKKLVRFIIPANAYSAATLISFSADEIIMDSMGTLGPIDPQINGIPARAILRAFETIEQRLKEEGPRALTAYIPLISKYDLHILEICKSAQEYSKELAKKWLSNYMLKGLDDDNKLNQIVEFFSNYDIHKSHGRSINREKAREIIGQKVKYAEEIEGLSDLIRSLYNQYELWFDKTPFYKVFENARGINWGRQTTIVQFAPMGEAILNPKIKPPSIPETSA